jgi:hypothetical protein
MGFLSRAEDEEEYTGEKWEYKARNLAKVVGPGLEDDFKKFGADGWEFVAVAKDYAIFKRRSA